MGNRESGQPDVAPVSDPTCTWPYMMGSETMPCGDKAEAPLRSRPVHW